MITLAQLTPVAFTLATTELDLLLDPPTSALATMLTSTALRAPPAMGGTMEQAMVQTMEQTPRILSTAQRHHQAK